MALFFSVVAFEVRRRVKMLSSWVYALVFFASSALLVMAQGGVFKSVSANSGTEKVMVNSPHALFAMTSTFSLFGLLAVAAIFGRAAHEDFAQNTWQIVFTKNVNKTSYFLGRFTGAWVFSCGVLFSIAVGELFGCGVVGLVDAKQLTTFNLFAFVWPFIVQLWPMLLTCGALFFSLAALTRRMAPVYVGMVVLVMGYLALSTAFGDVNNRDLGAMLDPFGMFAFRVTTQYWSPAERNSQLVPLTGVLLANRALWVAVGLAMLAVTIARFRPLVEELSGSGKKQLEGEAAPAPMTSVVAVQPAPTAGSWFTTMLSSGWAAFTEVVRSPVYWSFVVAGLALELITVSFSGRIFGTETLPLTFQVLEMMSDSFSLFSLITLTFYAGEIVWREKDNQLDDIVAATRMPSWVNFFGKLVALLLVVASLQVVVGLSALLWQVGHGFFDIEWRLYAIKLTLFGFMPYALLAVMALVLQVLINQKYLAHFAMVVFYVQAIVLQQLGIEEKLFQFGDEPEVKYSDMNGFGQRLEGLAAFRAYWWAWAALLLLVAWLFVVRGRESGWAMRAREAGRRFTAPMRAAGAVFVMVIAGFGSLIFYETHVLNPYVTAKDTERASAEYEKTFKVFAATPQPRITALEIDVQIYPEDPRLEARGTYTVKNKTDAAIAKVMVNLPRQLKPKVLTLNGEAAKSTNLKLGVSMFELSRPLEPDEEGALKFEVVFDSPGFAHEGQPHGVVGNGTFVNNFSLPIVGYSERAELTEDGDRKTYGLAPKERMRDRDDPVGLANNYIRQDSDLISYKATVCTAADQLPVTSGTLMREWQQDGRSCAQYESDQPILAFVSFLSARYARRLDAWNGVKLEIDYHPGHTFNLERMMKGMKDALTYCSEQFGPYQHHQARIIEFPRYASFAQSFPNTIPYSEGIGFIAKVRDGDPKDLDYPYYITAHEVAHQWFAHQVIGANTQGATVTSETLAQYAALMVMKHTYGEAKMRRFLKYELDRYLMGRAIERKKEVPLGRVENQGYIHYQKGSLVMYSLQDLIGEDAVNRAIKKYVSKVRFQGPPYTNATELIAFLRAETPAEQQSLIDDLFESIVIYENRALSASMKPLADGAYEVSVKVKSTKYRADENGKQDEVDPNPSELINVGAIDEKGDALLLEKRHVPKGESELVFTVKSKPAKVGIDPMNELVDKTPDDNLTVPAEAAN